MRNTYVVYYAYRYSYQKRGRSQDFFWGKHFLKNSKTFSKNNQKFSKNYIQYFQNLSKMFIKISKDFQKNNKKYFLINL